jgi:hypothetical protein
MAEYPDLPGFEHLYLEDSWVLGVGETEDGLTFDVETVLNQDHQWTPPKPGEVHCHQRLLIAFRRPTSIEWIERFPGPPATDATGQKDYGHIDTFLCDDERYELNGNWGHVVVHGPAPAVISR